MLHMYICCTKEFVWTEALETWNKTGADISRSHFGKHQCNFYKIMQYLEKGGMLTNPQGVCLFFWKIGFFFVFNDPFQSSPPTKKKKKTQTQKPSRRFWIWLPWIAIRFLSSKTTGFCWDWDNSMSEWYLIPSQASSSRLLLTASALSPKAGSSLCSRFLQLSDFLSWNPLADPYFKNWWQTGTVSLCLFWIFQNSLKLTVHEGGWTSWVNIATKVKNERQNQSLPSLLADVHS